MRECLDEGVLQGFCDGELQGVQAEGVRSHLTRCATCSATVAELMDQMELVAAAMAPEFQAAVPTERLHRRIDLAVAGLRNAELNQHHQSLAARLRGWFTSLPTGVGFGQQGLGYAALAIVLAIGSVFGIAYFRQPEAPTQVTARVDNPVNPVVATAPAGTTASPAIGPAVSPAISPATTATATKRTGTIARAATVHTRNATSPAVAKVKLLPGERSYLKTIAALDSTIESANDRPMRPALRAEYERNLALVDRALAAARNAAKNNPNDPDAAEFVFAAYQSKVDLLNTVADARVYNRQP